MTETMKIRHVKLDPVDEKLVYATMSEEELRNPQEVIRRFERNVLPAEDGQITKWYKDKSIFITGGTGFFGKVLLEKLLRTCHELSTIYILVRSKRGKDMKARVEEMFDDVIFEKLRKEQPKFLHKIVAIGGDVGLPQLGITKQDRETLTSNVSIIFHGAATVRFDEKLKIAVAINVRGVKEILDIARECKKLESFTHVSSAFANCPQRFIEEKFYPPPMDSDKIIEMVDAMSEKQIEELTPKLLGDWPNTYAYTKAIAEDTARQYGQGLPLSIIRPSIVIATYNEPIRGWIDNVYGPTGVLVGAGTGVIRSLYCNKKSSADIVPVDMVVNCMITSAWRTAIDKSKTVPIYNYVSGVQNPVTWEDFMRTNMKYGMRVPTNKAIWYLSFRLNKYRFVDRFFVFFLHFLPALIVDGIAFALGRKPKLVKVYKKINKFSEVLSYFSIGRWRFTDYNTQRIWSELSQPDKDNFFFGMSELDWDLHSRTHLAGVRQYLVKDDLSTLPEAKRRWYILRILHYVVNSLLVLLLLRVAWWLLSVTVGI